MTLKEELETQEPRQRVCTAVILKPEMEQGVSDVMTSILGLQISEKIFAWLTNQQPGMMHRQNAICIHNEE